VHRRGRTACVATAEKLAGGNQARVVAVQNRPCAHGNDKDNAWVRTVVQTAVQALLFLASFTRLAYTPGDARAATPFPAKALQRKRPA
jgi:hypothetical protein